MKLDLRYLAFGLAMCGTALCANDHVQAATIWGPTAGGTYAWNTNSNWDLTAPDVAFPNAVGALANLSTKNIAANQVIELNQLVTVGELRFGDTSGNQTFTIDSGTGGSLRFNNGGNSTLARVAVGSNANSTINANVEITDTLSVYAANGTILFGSPGAITGSGTINNTAPGSDTTIRGIHFDGDLSEFTGTFSFNRTANNDQFRFWALNPGSADAANAKFVLSGVTGPGSSTSLIVGRVDGAVFKMGELSGTGGRIEDDLSGANPSTTLEVGYLATNSSYSGVIADRFDENRTLHFTKAGGGVLALNGDNAYHGITTVNAGTLLVNGDHLTGGTYTVTGPATLGGNGAIGTLVDPTVVNLSGTISPGGTVTGNVFADTADTLTIGSLTLQSGASAFFELDATNPASANNDLIAILGTLTGTGGTFAINVEAFGGGLLAGDNTWTLASYESLSGTLPAFSVSGVNPGYNYAVALTNLSGGAGEVQLTLTVIPEPGSIFLAALGTVGIVGIARRKRQ